MAIVYRLTGGLQRGRRLKIRTHKSMMKKIGLSLFVVGDGVRGCL